MAGFKVGDRVKVTIEGEVGHVGRASIEVRTNLGVVYIPSFATVGMEVIPPPETFFKRGDVVMDKGNSGFRYALGEGGYLDLSSGLFIRSHKRFSDRYYKKV